jgi:hypothetical protein
MCAYLWFASDLWISSEEFGESGGPGDAFYVMFVLVPFLLVFALLDAAVLIVIIWRAYRSSRWPRTLCTWVAIMSLWTAVIAIDRLKAFNIINLN